ncbi:glucan 1,4-alpha-glucosidase [Asticcacaulis machinosus]|uniref:Glucan 1,4-alpha-glucosidase n=1 Tax=Asticcacaulis machinosus TaxID=2984211 RepID=A0ABT5HMK5_9CAUL|nr:glucan 1,4-alpha-glucosidase [Asticcacaulis machinosus]MDC7677479.1 glucan 1,4-alpha-glucosidase [Asticcacaulis machinosus]
MTSRLSKTVVLLMCSAATGALSLTANAQEVASNAAHTPNQIVQTEATDGPGEVSPWAYSAKQGIGASYEAYKDFHYSDDATTGKVSKVWFSLADGVVTETMSGLIHEAQIRELQIAIAGKGYVALETTDTTSKIEYIHTDPDGRPLSPAYRLTNTDKEGRFVIVKDIFTDPDHQTLMMRVTVKALKGPVTPYIVLDPSVANTSGDDQGRASPTALQAFEGDAALSLKASVPFKKASVGFTGKDGLASLLTTQKLGKLSSDTGGVKGNIRLIGELAPVTTTTTFDVALGFGSTTAAADAQAAATLKTGYAKVLANYNGEGAAIGWEDYLASLGELKSLVPVTEDNGKLLYASALALKVQEDRTYSGALIASLSNPWGDTATPKVSATGYKAVWPRDFYQVAMAMAALGDKETPVAAFRYLPKVQVGAHTPGNKGDGGWYLQKAHVDGTPEWVGVQLDQTAMPIMLGWKLESLGLISKHELVGSYKTSLKKAADFLSFGGTPNLGWNNQKITPPYSQQERWEEQEGHSPSTTAAVIAGLLVASDIATQAGDATSAATYKSKALDYSAKLDQRLYTTKGEVAGAPQSYYLRISRSEDANTPGVQDERNGRVGLHGDKVIDAGFLELVRYGVRPARDAKIAQSLTVIDNETIAENLRVKYTFKGKYPGFRRYGNDGYGEDQVTGGNYAVFGQSSPNQRGRVWPIFTGERGHYELALATAKGATDADIARIRDTYVAAMEYFANDGLMLPEQVWDGVGAPSPHGYAVGDGTDSATPLAWTHAEYVKLLRSVRDRKVWDHYPVVADQLTK